MAIVPNRYLAEKQGYSVTIETAVDHSDSRVRASEVPELLFCKDCLWHLQLPHPILTGE